MWFSMSRQKGKKKCGRMSNILLIVTFFVGLSLLLYPIVSDWWNSMHQSRAVAAYVEEVEDLSAEKKEKILQEAADYNRKLAENVIHFPFSAEEEEEYNRVLDITGTGIMGYIDVPKINVQLPIYHGTDEAILQIAIGHIMGSSFPVGGKNTHAVVSGHRGLPSAKLFTNLDKLKEGDQFMFRVLDKVLTYKVDQILIVEPDQVESLQIQNGRDFCTLVTCTPYGVNTHRLLVRGHRIANGPEARTILVTADAIQLDPVVVAPILAVPILLVLLLMVLFGGRKRMR